MKYICPECEEEYSSKDADALHFICPVCEKDLISKFSKEEAINLFK
jgi:transcription initiation factor IIE alpha subunit